ncbi:MAG: hypothetical protein QXT64_02840 [Desulfurococcaceae archaeon]
MRELLPLLDGWEWDILFVDTPVMVTKGERKELYRKTVRGWVYGAIVVCDSGELVGRIMVDKVRAFEDSAKLLDIAGLTYSGVCQFMQLTRYSPTDKVYTVMYSPPEPFPCKGELLFEVSLPAGATVNYSVIAAHGAVIASVTDYNAFVDSLRRVLGTARYGVL